MSRTIQKYQARKYIMKGFRSKSQKIATKPSKFYKKTMPILQSDIYSIRLTRN